MMTKAMLSCDDVCYHTTEKHAHLANRVSSQSRKPGFLMYLLSRPI
jgi:hypothetical protein